jgi:hypothetical protein
MLSHIIYVFGNKELPSDSAAISLLSTLQQSFPTITFLHVDPTEEWLQPGETHPIIIDTVHGISDVTICTDMSQFKKYRGSSVHDFDLSTELPLLFKIGKIKSVSIIGVPIKRNSSTLEQIINHISSLADEYEGSKIMNSSLDLVKAR